MNKHVTTRLEQNKRYIRESPRAYGLPVNATDSEIDSRARKILGLPPYVDPAAESSGDAVSKQFDTAHIPPPVTHTIGSTSAQSHPDDAYRCDIADIPSFVKQNDGYTSFEVLPDRVVFRGPRKIPCTVLIAEIAEPVTVSEGKMWGSITLVPTTGNPTIMRGFRAGTLRIHALKIDSLSEPYRNKRSEEQRAEDCRIRKAQARELYDTSKSEVEQAYQTLITLFQPDQTVTTDDVEGWLNRYKAMADVITLLEPDARTEDEQRQAMMLESFIAHPHTTLTDHNERVIRRDRARQINSAQERIARDASACQSFFDSDSQIRPKDQALFVAQHRFAPLFESYDESTVSEELRSAIQEIREFFRLFESRIAQHNDRVQRAINLKIVLANENIIRSLIADLRALEQWPGYVRPVHMEQLLGKLRRKSAFWHLPLSDAAADHELVDSYSQLAIVFDTPEEWRRARNERFLALSLNTSKDFFDGVLGSRHGRHGLSEEQRIACIVDDSRVRIVAGAGSGKTTVLMAKAAYLVERLGVLPNRILAITYSNKSAADLKERFGQRPSLRSVKISTIHGLGSAILAAAQGRKASLPSWLDDLEAFARRIDGYVSECFREPGMADAMSNVLLFNSREIEPPYSFDSVAQYFDYQKHVRRVSLRGERMKSLQECLIANFLFVNGIEYCYEADYCVKTVTPEFRQYRPDFFVPSAKLYIEHYGIGRNGETAPNVDRYKYAEGIEWKQATHERNGTSCIETFSYEAVEGTLIAKLATELRNYNVPFKPIASEAVLLALKERGRITELHTLFKRFISLFKERADRNQTITDLYSNDTFLLTNLVPILDYLFLKYQADLKREQESDFSDMIVEARAILPSTSNPYDVIMLDEAQDLSAARAELIRMLITSGRDVRFCAVGDDWQSVYRFSGSDTSLFVRFEAFFGPGTLLCLNATHRFDDGIALPAGRFVTKNPEQIKRTSVAAPVRDDRPRLSILEFEDFEASQVTGALEYLASRWNLDRASVMVIARTNDGLSKDVAAIARAYPSTTISFKTAHGAKGLEADFAIVVDAVEGWNGFPSLRPGDAVIEPLLPKAEDYPFAEDRRLFYVAMTRARKAVVFCAHAGTPSRFLRELQDLVPSLTSVSVPYAQTTGPAVTCRSCGVGRYRVEDGQYGPFASCSEYPQCRESCDLCPVCSGFITFVDDMAGCATQGCAFKATRCGRCERGWLVQKESRFGTFWGCNRWRPSDDGCGFTLRGMVNNMGRTKSETDALDDLDDLDIPF